MRLRYIELRFRLQRMDERELQIPFYSHLPYVCIRNSDDKQIGIVWWCMDRKCYLYESLYNRPHRVIHLLNRKELYEVFLFIGQL